MPEFNDFGIKFLAQVQVVFCVFGIPVSHESGEDGQTEERVFSALDHFHQGMNTGSMPEAMDIWAAGSPIIRDASVLSCFMEP